MHATSGHAAHLCFRLATVAAAAGLHGAALGQVGLEGWATADNLFVAYVSTDDLAQGDRFMEGNYWPWLMNGRYEFPAPGRYYLHVRATNEGGPAMFMARFELDAGAQFDNGTRTLVTLPQDWRVSATGFGENYLTPADLGANGVSPWGTFPGVGAARYLWHPTEMVRVYFSAPIDVGAACRADCDTSTGAGVLDIFDFLCFQNRFAQSDPYACDYDTSTGAAVCDIFDFLAFQNAFAAGCP